MNVPTADHPIWALARTGLFLIGLLMCFHYNYSTFDPVKDPRAILIMAIIGGGGEFISWLISRYTKSLSTSN